MRRMLLSSIHDSSYNSAKTLIRITRMIRMNAIGVGISDELESHPDEHLQLWLRHH